MTMSDRDPLSGHGRRCLSRLRRLAGPILVIGIVSTPKAQAGNDLALGAVLDAGYVSQSIALQEERDRGFGLGHTELTASGNIDDSFRAQATATFHSHDGETELDLEEAWFETTRLPAGLTVRAGRFLSQIGYLNGQHLHADDFTTRPLLYRAFLGSHYGDDGLRVNWTAPTDLYFRLGAEFFRGRRLVSESTTDPSLGVATLSAKLGGDIGRANSWQIGLSHLYNRREAAIEEEDGPDLVLGGGAEMQGHDHDHDHGSSYSGRHMWLADVVWKWAPEGANRNRQLRIGAEFARVSDLNEFAASDDVHEAWSVSAVYRFHPQWEVGLRHGDLKVSAPHGDHFHRGSLAETSVMLAWKRSHFSTMRLQWTQQRDRGDFDDAGNALFLQVVMSLGAHGAHDF
jgi:hypothetical protein